MHMPSHLTCCFWAAYWPIDVMAAGGCRLCVLPCVCACACAPARLSKIPVRLRSCVGQYAQQPVNVPGTARDRGALEPARGGWAQIVCSHLPVTSTEAEQPCRVAGTAAGRKRRAAASLRGCPGGRRQGRRQGDGGGEAVSQAPAARARARAPAKPAPARRRLPVAIGP